MKKLPLIALSLTALLHSNIASANTGNAVIVAPAILAVSALMLPKALYDNAKFNKTCKKTPHHLTTNMGSYYNTFHNISPLSADYQGLARTPIDKVGQLPNTTKVAVYGNLIKNGEQIYINNGTQSINVLADLTYQCGLTNLNAKLTKFPSLHDNDKATFYGQVHYDEQNTPYLTLDYIIYDKPHSRQPKYQSYFDDYAEIYSDELIALAKEGYPHAQYQLAILWKEQERNGFAELGRDDSKTVIDPKLAGQLLQAAANAEDEWAMMSLAIILKQGGNANLGIAPNQALYNKYYQKVPQLVDATKYSPRLFQGWDKWQNWQKMTPVDFEVTIQDEGQGKVSYRLELP